MGSSNGGFGQNLTEQRTFAVLALNYV